MYTENTNGRVAMRTAQARLVKRITDDGFVQVEDHVPIGATYEVLLDSVEDQCGINLDALTYWIREGIQTTDGQWLPTELLEIIDHEEEPIKWRCQK